MRQIELENWGKSPENPNKTVYIGQRTAQEVFAELRHRLESVGMLPDEYFLLDSQWENGREIPKNAHIFGTVMYGESEGIYLDIGIRWDENEKRHVTSFATGKTLGESEGHLDRMYLTASAVNKALYSSEPHARYMVVGGKEKTLEDSVLHLSGAERNLLIESLVERRNNLLQETTATEQLLRRVTGSITEFVNEVGAKPLQISPYDMAVIAIADGNIAAFQEACKNCPDDMGELLIHAAGRPGKVGFDMTSAILTQAKSIPNETYLAACKNAVTASDTNKALLLASSAEKCVANLDMELYGEIISMAISENKRPMALELVKQCTPEQIQGANSYILVQAANTNGSQLPFAIAEKGIDITDNAANLIRALNYHHNGWVLKHLFERGMKLNSQSLYALQACVKVDSVEMGKTLIDRGVSFERYERWAVNNSHSEVGNETFAALKQYWSETARQERTETTPKPGQTEKQPIADRLEAAQAKADAHNAARPAPDAPNRTAKATEH